MSAKFRSKNCILLSILLLGVALLSGCFLQSKEASAKKPDAKQTLVVYTCFSEEIYGPIITEFEETYDLWVKVVPGTYEEILGLVVSEEALPEGDIVFGIDHDKILSYSEYFVSYSHFAYTPYVLLYNNDLVDKQSLSPSDFDALDKENVSYEDLQTSVSRVTAGDSLVCVSTEQLSLLGMQNNKNLSILYPEEEKDLNYGTLVIRDCPHPENAEKFVDFLGHQNVQQYLPAYCYLRPIRDDVGINRDLYPESEAKHER